VLENMGRGALGLGAALAIGTVIYAVFPRQRGAMVRVGSSGVAVEGTW
jgi:hypothetical protein